MKKLPKKYKFEVVSGYGEFSITAPDGYEFQEFIVLPPSVNSNGYTNYPEVRAVFVENIEVSELINNIEERKKKEIETAKTDIDRKFQEKIKKMELEQIFSEIITKFNIGDTVYYYQEMLYYDNVSLEQCIKSFTLSSVVYEKEQVGIVKDKNDDYAGKYLVLKGWSERNQKITVANAFKTKDEALEKSVEYHNRKVKEWDDKQKEYKEKQAKAEKEKEEEILRKAEEIKAKQK